MEEEHNTVNVSVIWRGKKLDVGINSGATLKDFGHKLQNLTSVKSDTLRLLVPRSLGNNSKLLNPFSDEHSGLSLQETSILKGKFIRMMGVFENEIEELSQNGKKTDLRIAGFDEEEKRLKQRTLHRPQGLLKLPQGTHIFCDFRTLLIPGVELNPPASEALRRMHMLAADPGIVAIMNKHRWRVGIMTEMAPVGYVGVNPKCILGYNKNQGEEISLRLRTDDLKGFRKYESIKKTLLHELAHMVYSEHDADFYALDKQLNHEAATLDWTKSRSYTLSSHRLSDHYEEDYYVEAVSTSQRLGGNTSDQFVTARESSVAAAYRRMANLSTNGSSGLEVHVEPDPDDAGFQVHAEPDPDDSELQVHAEPDPDDAGFQVHAEPDPDDSGLQVHSEPDPDDSVLKGSTQVGYPMEADREAYGELEGTHRFDPDKSDSLDVETMETETCSGINGNGIICEPLPSSCLGSELVCHSRTSGPKTFVEPDPDDDEARGRTSKWEVIAEPNTASQTMEDEIQLRKTCLEPDPDESLPIETMQVEPDPDDDKESPTEICNPQAEEPDPDDDELRRIKDPVAIVCTRLQKAIQMLTSEVNSMEATSVIQTLFKIIQNVIEHPEEKKFQRLRKANPQFQRKVANYKAAMDVLFLVGFIEDDVYDEIGRLETYLVLKRNDPGLLWIAKSSLETCVV